MKNFKRFLGELIGTFIVLTLSLGLASTIGFTEATLLTPTVYNALVVGIFVLSYAASSSALAAFSGGHFNPAVSIGIWFTGFFKKKGKKKLLKFHEFVLDLAGQIAGALCATILLIALFGEQAEFGINDIPGTLSALSYDYLEMVTAVQVLLVAVFTFVVAALNEQDNKNTGLISGLTLGAVMMVGIPLTGGCLNPFRFVMGATVYSIYGDASWFTFELVLVNIISPLVGGIIGGTIYGLISLTNKKKEENPIDDDDEEMPESYKKMYEESLKEAEVSTKVAYVEAKPVTVAPVVKVVKEEKPVIKQEETLVAAPVVTAAPQSEFPIQIERKSFEDKLKEADKDLVSKYEQIKNEILSYSDIKSRISFEGETFRSHRNALVFIALRGKGIKCCFHLDPKQFADSPIPVDDQSSKRKYAEYPTVLKVKSDLSCKRALTLVQQVMEEAGITK